MKVICYGSSSRGNGYILQGKKETLLIEAGLPLSNVRKYIKDFKKVQGCIITHSHGDHSKYIGDFMKAGITCYANDDVWDCYDTCAEKYPNNVGQFKGPMKITKIGEFDVIPMYANHDVPCFAYLIMHYEMGSLLFLTDSAGFNCTFNTINHVMIECNWSEDCLQQAIEEGRTNWYVAKRSRETHMGLEVLLNYLKNEPCFEQADEVILLHLSHENSDPQQFQQIVSESLNKPTYVAEYGLQIDLSK
jgi:phosphoribosyl 1,2-cyclic phosphodiesterase